MATVQRSFGFWEGPPGLEPAGETAPEVGVVVMSVFHVLLGVSPGNPPFWVKDLGFVGGDVQEYGEGARGFPKSDHGKEGGATEGRYLEAGGSREGP